MTTPTVEDIKDIILSFVQDLCIGEENKRRAVVTVSKALTIYGQSRYDKGAKAERERVAELLDDTRHANGFMGFTDSEWNGAKKFIQIFLNTHLTTPREDNQ